MTYDGVRSDLRNILLTVPGLPTDVHWQGRPHAPQAGVPYMKEQLSPVDSEVTTLGGQEGLTREYWSYFTDLLYPQGDTSLTTLETLGDAIREAFYVGRVVGGVSNHGYVTRNYRYPEQDNSGWMQVRVQIDGWHMRGTQPAAP